MCLFVFFHNARALFSPAGYIYILAMDSQKRCKDRFEFQMKKPILVKPNVRFSADGWTDRQTYTEQGGPDGYEVIGINFLSSFKEIN